MKKHNKKGFTIVELVIVIAVIAILAAVLIPTFSSLVAKANLSADSKAERDMNTALAIEQYPDNLDAVIDALVASGFNKEHLIPVSNGYSFAWNENTKKIELVEGELPAGYHNLKNLVKYIDVVATDAETFEQALLNKSEYIKLEANITVPAAVQVPEGANITIDLNGKTLSAGYSDSTNTNHAYAINVYGSLTLKNGTVESRGIRLFKENASIVVEEGVTVNAIDSTGGYCIYTDKGGNVTINGGVFNALNGDTYDDFNSEPGAIWFKGNGNLTINGGTFNVKSGAYAITYQGTGTCDISNAVVNAYRGAISIYNATATLKNVTAKVEYDSNKAYHAIACYDSTITVEGGDYSRVYNGDNAQPVIGFIKDETNGSVIVKVGVKVNGVVCDSEVTATQANNPFNN